MHPSRLISPATCPLRVGDLAPLITSPPIPGANCPCAGFGGRTGEPCEPMVDRHSYAPCETHYFRHDRVWRKSKSRLRAEHRRRRLGGPPSWPQSSTCLQSTCRLTGTVSDVDNCLPCSSLTCTIRDSRYREPGIDQSCYPAPRWSSGSLRRLAACTGRRWPALGGQAGATTPSLEFRSAPKGADLP